MEYNSFLPEDFICDESFQNFCLGAVQKDVQFWQSWIAQNPQKKNDVEQAMQIVRMLNANQGSLLEQKSILKDTFIRRESFRKKVFDTPNAKAELERQPIVSIKRKYFLAAAAACAALFILAGAYWLQKDLSEKGNEKEVAGKGVYQSGLQPRNTIILSDGSLVTLAKNSSIKLGENFSSGKRELTLYGEAYFDIKHDSTSPFRVHTSRMELVVLGTVFSVRDFTDSSSSEALLISGRLRVTSKRDSKYMVVLKPNESVVITDKENKEVAQPKAMEPIFVAATDTAGNKRNLGWIHNRLSIDDEPLSEIAQKLQEWYGIQITFADESVKNYRYSGIFESETVVQALQALQLSYPFKFTSTPQQIIITK